jgi:hypothetical protein
MLPENQNQKKKKQQNSGSPNIFEKQSRVIGAAFLLSGLNIPERENSRTGISGELI